MDSIEIKTAKERLVLETRLSELAKEQTGFNSQDSFPVGADCARKMPGYTYEGELEKSHPYFK